MKYDSSRKQKSWLIYLCYALLIFLLSWPSWLNGQAFFFQDTTTYIKSAASGIELLAKPKVAEDWLHIEAHSTIAHTDTNIPPPATDNTQSIDEYASTPEKKGVLAGRSFYFGMYLFITTLLLSINFVPILNAVLSIVTIASISRAIGLTQSKIIGLLVLLAAITPLPFFNSLLMPDIFAGLAILAAAALMFVSPPNKTYTYLWSFILLLAVLFHTANILIIGGLLVISVCIGLLSGQPKAALLRRASLGLGIVLIGVGGEVFFNACVSHFTHTAPIRPPFISARLIADGPGKHYADKFCDNSEFEICNYKEILGKGSSDDFLWSVDKRIGAFTLADKPSRIRLSQQDSTFAIAVFKQYPYEVIQSTSRNILAQLTMVGLDEFNYPPSMVEGFSHKIPAMDFKTLVETKAASQTFPIRLSEALTCISIAASLLIFLLMRRRSNAENTTTIYLMSITIMSGILINAIICGALSTPHDRYQARIIWLLPLVACYLANLLLTSRPMPPRNA